MNRSSRALWYQLSTLFTYVLVLGLPGLAYFMIWLERAVHNFLWDEVPAGLTVVHVWRHSGRVAGWFW